MTVVDRFNNTLGVLGTNLTPTQSGLIANFFQTPPHGIPSFSSGQIVKLALDAGTASFEIVYMTAYTGSTSATISRAAEDASTWPATSHTALTSTWQVVPTVQDFTDINTGLSNEVTNRTTGDSNLQTQVNGKLAQSANLSDVAVRQTALNNLIGASTLNQFLRFNGTNWLPTTVASLPPTGTAGGDLAGTYPSPTVANIQGQAVSSATPVAGQSLTWNGSAWQTAQVIPTGVLQWYTGPASTPPPGWVVANGAVYATTGIYANLFNLYGFAYPGGNGTTTFAVPNLIGRFLFGANLTGPITTGGASTATLSTANLPSLAHTHNAAAEQFVIGIHGTSGYGLVVGGTAGFYVTLTTGTASALGGSATPVPIMPPYANVVPIIKL